ncbi:MAG TPA: glucosaminidase domain-containing protein [Polyangiaceae bacterium]|nr:glucosaminidase domain-containing protein [Polyangiaceae bacterium]
MRLSFAGPAAAALLLVLSLGQGERPATATEARAAAPVPGVTAVSRAAPAAPLLAAVAEQPPPVEATTGGGAQEPENPPRTDERDGARSSITPMAREEALVHLSEAWQRSQGEAPSDHTLAILCAHWAHETDHGRRMYGYNFGGIKGTSPSGASVVVWTRERTDEARLVRRTFRSYASPEEGARDYVTLLAERYSAAFRAAREKSIERFVSALGARGYFTDDEQVYLRSLSRLARDCGPSASASRR